MKESNIIFKTACFSGNRKIKENIKFINDRLDNAIEELYEKGVIYYGSGGALGFDKLAALAVIRAKKKHPEIKLILIKPCKDQRKFWPVSERKEYEAIEKQCDKVVCLAERYSQKAMMDRNKHMIDNSQYLICYNKQEKGGAVHAISYAKRKRLSIIDISDRNNN